MSCNCSSENSQCPTFRLRDPNDDPCRKAPTPLTFYGRVVSGTGQSYIVDIFENGPQLPLTDTVVVNCPDLTVDSNLDIGYPLIVVKLTNGNYLSLPTVLIS